MAYEQAESSFAGWMRSCWPCLSSNDESSSSDQKNDGDVHREILSSQTQPHLVPPMKLVVHDDLPTPGVHDRRPSSLSSWVVESRSLASRASMNPKRHSTAAPLKIGGPTDFRRVQSFQPQTTLTNYRPLELKIHQTGNRLPDLPEFDSFQLDEDPHRRTLAVPPRTLAPSGLGSRRCHSTTSAIPRKPVGSGNPRSWDLYEPVIQQPPPVRIASAYIPHFSTVNPVETTLPQPSIISSVPSSISSSTTSESDLGETTIALSTEWPGHPSTAWAVEDDQGPPQTPQTPRATKVQDEDGKEDEEQEEELPSVPPFSFNDSPSTASSRTMPSQISSLHRPSIDFHDKRMTIASLPNLSSRVTQWFFPGKAGPPQSVSLVGEDGFSWERTRTLSGSTMASTVTTITGGAKARQPNMSISSTFTSASTPRSSLRGLSPTVEKELDLVFSQPTIYEDRQQRFSDSPV